MQTLTTHIYPQVEVLPRSLATPGALDDAALLEAFGQFIDRDVADGRATDDTRRTYECAIKPFLAYCDFQNIPLAKVSTGQVKNYRTHLRDKGYALETVNLYLTAVRRLYDAAIEYELLKANPATRVKGGDDGTAPEDKMSALSEKALQALLNALPSSTLPERRARLIVALMSFHGLRRVETHRLDHEHLRVDSDGGVLQVLGKGGKTRRVYLRADTLRCWQQYEAAKFDAGWQMQGPLFIALDNNSCGKRLHRQSFNGIVDMALAAVDLKRNGVSCHALRHTFGTLSVAGGAKVEHLRDALGHSSLTVTSQYVRAVEKQKHNPSLCIGATMDFGD